MVDFFYKNKAVLFFSALTGVILWQMLMPGYVLTLDMVFGPKFILTFDPERIWNDLPLNLALSCLYLVFPGWVVQKLVLFALFFCIGFLAYKYFPAGKRYYANWWAGIFYTINPFVYERFLAGHWTHLFAYAFLPPLLNSIFRLFKERGARNWLVTLAWLQAILIFSLHLGVMAAILFFLYGVVYLILQIDKKQLFYRIINLCRSRLELKDAIESENRKKIFWVLLFIILNAYWLVPFFIFHSSSAIGRFGPEQWQAFAPGFRSVPIFLNILSLYGFWGEKFNWSGYFLWPQDHLIFWAISGIGLLSLVIYGFYRSLASRRQAKIWFFLLSGIAAAVFASGAAPTLFQSFNHWMFKNAPLWSGFRDSQKWSAVLVIAYAYFGAMGASQVVKLNMQKLNRLSEIIKHQLPKTGTSIKKLQITLRLRSGQANYKLQIVLIFLLPLLYTYTMIGGFARQIHPVWYPASWQEADRIMGEDPDRGKILFLPWHMYFSLDFNQKLITSNPASVYFNREVVKGKNMEIGGIFSAGQGVFQTKIEKIVLHSDRSDNKEVISELSKQGIAYVLYIDDLSGIDPIKYQFLSSPDLQKVYSGQGLTLYKIVLK